MLLNLMKDSQEFTSLEEKKMLLLLKILLPESQFTTKRELAFRTLERKKKLNIELGIPSDQKLQQPLLEDVKTFTSNQEAKFFILALLQEQQYHM